MRPVGPIVENWTIPPIPQGQIVEGRYVQLEPLDADKHAALLYRAVEGHEELWTYLPYGPFSSASQYHRWVRQMVDDPDTVFYAVKNLDNNTYGGVFAYLRIMPSSGSIEVGHINFAPAIHQSRAATEAIYLVMKWAFDNGYRRFEWKCDALNAPSRRAAQRFGFNYEGVFRQAAVVKGRNRDTAWFAVIDREWPALKQAYDVWLSPSNFDANGRQRERLGDLTGLVRVASDPTL